MSHFSSVLLALMFCKTHSFLFKIDLLIKKPEHKIPGSWPVSKRDACWECKINLLRVRSSSCGDRWQWRCREENRIDLFPLVYQAKRPGSFHGGLFLGQSWLPDLHPFCTCLHLSKSLFPSAKRFCISRVRTVSRWRVLVFASDRCLIHLVNNVVCKTLGVFR